MADHDLEQTTDDADTTARPAGRSGARGSRRRRRDDGGASPGPVVGRALPAVRAKAAGDVTGTGADVLVVPLAPPAAGEPDPQPRAGVADAAAAYGVDLPAACAQERFTGAVGQVLTLPVGALTAGTAGLPGRLVLLGVGDGGPTALRRAGAALARATRGAGRVATTAVHGATGEAVRAFTEGYLLGAYSPPRTGTSEGPRPPATELVLLGCRRADDVERARTAARATWVVRDLAATPASTKSPQWVADQARALAADVPGLDVQVVDADALRDRGFGGLVAVGGGSATPPCLVTVTWTPPEPAARSRHVVLVGKGITFDTGGLSIKPREAMVPMKTDMAGSAVVLAAVLAAAEVGVGHGVTALLPLAENAFGAAAYRPGDVVTVFGGTTVEVANTDAEGRMVLADALAYADAHLDPDVLVDVATLTGAASLGLGKRHAALYTADDRLASALADSAERTGERVWRMPLVEEYRPYLDSEVADIRHVTADRSVSGGSITAALFLREFVGDRRWVHLDVAGPSRADRDEHEVTKGASGYGARLLLDWLTRLR
ncbi:leucyl aminopeptidase family protein [Thalassiella azotivora]